jgi:hypothetical protein
MLANARRTNITEEKIVLRYEKSGDKLGRGEGNKC